MSTGELVLCNRLHEFCARSVLLSPYSTPHGTLRAVRTPVVNLIIARVNRALEQLIHLLLAHLLSQIRQDVLDLAFANEARPVLVKHLEATDVFLDVERFAEATGAVEDFGEGLEIDCSHVSVVALHSLLL